MWEWFTTNSVWILVASAVVLTLILFLRQRLRSSIEKSMPEKWRKGAHRSANFTFFTIGGVTLVVVVTALVAIILSRQGAHTVITPETIQKWLLEHGIIILVIIIISFLVYQLLKVVIPEIVERSVKARGKGRRAREEVSKRAQTLSSILSSTFGIIIAIIAIFMILSEVGVNIAPLLASAGVVGIAVGFGAQSLIKDLLSGLFILLEDQYNKGDVVRVAGIAGLVEDINLKRTILRDLDGTVHSIPNGEITTASNLTKEWSRVNLNITVAYGEDLDHVIGVINRVGGELAQDETFGRMIIGAPRVLRVDNFGDSGIEIKILGETKPLMQWDVTGELRKRLKEAFDKEKIEIPWPHLKLYFGQSQSIEYLTCKACSHPNLPDSKFCTNCGASLSL